MNNIVKTCCIIHNMIVKHRMSQYSGTQCLYIDDNECSLTSDIRVISRGRQSYEQAAFWRDFIDPFESSEEQIRLKYALMNHIWYLAGDDE